MNARALVPLLLLSAGVMAPPAVAVPASTPAGGGASPTRYEVSLRIESTYTAGPFTGSALTTAEFVAQPTTTTGTPTAWQGSGPLTVANESYSGLPGCTLSKPPSTGEFTVSITQTGESIEVTWTSQIDVPPLIGSCQGVPFATTGSSPIQPFLMLEPQKFTQPKAGGVQDLSGAFAGNDNNGSLTLQRLDCFQKVTAVNTYPPGQSTPLTARVGQGLTGTIEADVNVEFVLDDGSVVRLAKGAKLKNGANCETYKDTSRSFKGTLLLGLIWAKVTKVFGSDNPEPVRTERGVTGVRGTEFSVSDTKKRSAFTVYEGKIYVQRLRRGTPVGPKVDVKAGRTAIIRDTGPIEVHKTRPKEEFPFGIS